MDDFDDPPIAAFRKSLEARLARRQGRTSGHRAGRVRRFATGGAGGAGLQPPYLKKEVPDGVPGVGEGSPGAPDDSPRPAHLYLTRAGGRENTRGSAGCGGTL
jgi:hypothetical protein